MKKLVVAMMVALMTTVSVCAQRVKRFETETLLRAEELMNEGKLDESLIYFEAELKENPKNAYAYLLVTTVYMELGRYDEAMISVEKTIKYLPKSHREMRGIAHALKATIHEKSQEWEEAIEQLDLCLKVLPNDNYRHLAVAHRQRGEIYYKLGQHELAEQDFKKSKELKSLMAESSSK
ncbi:MAG: tetratricopeptide repeat protein [Bacteroidaceae bacterium]|nr:tetratricopeptide repeat protein [Bacteroidaceae bacterium]